MIERAEYRETLEQVEIQSISLIEKQQQRLKELLDRLNHQAASEEELTTALQIEIAQ